MSTRAYVASRKGLFTVDRTGPGSTPWRISRTHFLGDNLPMVLPDMRDGHVYAALGHGHFGSKMKRSRDEGATWEDCTAPAYPPKPADRPDDIDPMQKKPIPWNLELIWALETGGPDQSGVLWAGTIPGGLFRSDDHAGSWKLVQSLWDHPGRKEWFGGGAELPGIHSICIDPRDAQRITVGVSCGGVWHSTDGGGTWNCRADGMRAAYMPPERAFDPLIQDPHRVVQCRATPGTFWAQHHNGVFRSTDGLGSWKEIENIAPSTFGFAAAVHPSNGDVAWLVPASSDEHRVPMDGKVVVNRTYDGGKNWETLRRGLPQEHAYDLTFRHALDVDETGECLAFGTTTGALFVSDDGGDSWQTISTHLPPIYCVRFAR